jgi:hypothetical protein
MDEQNKFIIEKLRQPVPSDLDINVAALIDSWVGAAQDWCFAYAGPENLCPQEAFEGIEHLARLARCQPSMLQVEGLQTFIDLKLILLDSENSSSFSLAAEFLDLSAWLKQAQQAWNDETDDSALGRVLIEDLDASDFLLWYLEMMKADVPIADFESKLNQCYAWLDRHPDSFLLAEPYIRAVALTIRDDLDTIDETGLLSLSIAKYVRLIDECNESRELSQRPASVAPVLKQKPFGRGRRDYEFELVASAAGAADQFDASREPWVWNHPDHIYQALLIPPQSIVPNEEPFLEMYFAIGPDYLDPAKELLGRTTTLGNASATIESMGEGIALKVFARFRLNDVTSISASDVILSVDGQIWH